MRAFALRACLAAMLLSAPARADGGFPDPRQILLPVQRAQQIIVATNFGLLFSEDEGATWSFSCEQPLGAYAGPYLLAPPPAERLLAAAPSSGVIYSDDESCTWQAAQGPVANLLPYGLAIDPTNAQRIYAVGVPRDNLRSPESIYGSLDGGSTFGDPLYTAPAGHALLNLLVAPSLPSTLFAALYSGASRHPLLLRSDDHGQHWTTVADHAHTFGENPFDLLAIDPHDPQRLFARVLASSAESLAISEDGGLTFRLTASIPGKLNAFLQLESGTLLVAGQAATDPIAYRSPDGGQTFEPWPSAPRIHALAERAGKLYLAADNYLDGYAIGASDDEGSTIRPLAGFKDVSAVKACVSAACAKSCAYQAGINLWPEAVCGPVEEPPRDPVAEAGASGSDAGEEEPMTSGGGGVGGDAASEPKKLRRVRGGCDCSVPTRSGGGGAGAMVLVLVAALQRRTARHDSRLKM